MTRLPDRRAFGAALALGFLAYLAALACWFPLRTHYAGAVAAVATGAAFPLARIDGSVTVERSPRAIIFLYRLVHRAGREVSQVRQRFLNAPDVPLALATALALGFLSLRRRFVAAALTLALLFLAHVALVAWTAADLQAIVVRDEMSVAQKHVTLPMVARRLEAWGDTSPILVLGVTLLTGLRLRAPRRPSGGSTAT